MNPVIITLSFDIYNVITQTLDKVSYHSKSWKRKITDKKLWETNERQKIQRQMDRNPSTMLIERLIAAFKKHKSEIKASPKEMKNYFMSIDNTEVINSCIAKINEWLNMFGEGLQKIAESELKSIQRDTNELQRELSM